MVEGESVSQGSAASAHRRANRSVRAQIDRFYAIRMARSTKQRRRRKYTGTQDRRQTIVQGAELIKGARAAMELASLKNKQLKQAADAAQLLPPPATLHDPFSFDKVDGQTKRPNRRMVSPLSSAKARALKSCVTRVVYIPTPSPKNKAKTMCPHLKDTPDPRARLAERAKAGREFLRNSGLLQSAGAEHGARQCI